MFSSRITWLTMLQLGLFAFQRLLEMMFEQKHLQISSLDKQLMHPHQVYELNLGIYHLSQMSCVLLLRSKFTVVRNMCLTIYRWRDVPFARQETTFSGLICFIGGLPKAPKVGTYLSTQTTLGYLKVPW